MTHMTHTMDVDDAHGAYHAYDDLAPQAYMYTHDMPLTNPRADPYI